MIRFCWSALLFISLLPSTPLFTQVNEPKFDTYPIPVPRCLIQDSFGFIWIGTFDGLIRYDGYTFKQYTHIPFDSTSLSNNWIMDIKEDPRGNLWIGTFGGGLNYFDQRTETFISFNTDNFNYVSNFISKIIVNEDGSLWMGGIGLGVTLLKKNPDGSFHFTNFAFGDKSKTDLFGILNSALTLHKDTDGIIWIGSTTEGLIRFNPQTAEMKFYTHDPKNPKSISSNTISVISEDNFGNLWLGTGHPNIPPGVGQGLNKFNRKTGEFIHFKHDPSQKNSLCSNTISSLLIDYSGTMWIGSIDNYLNSIPLNDLLSKDRPEFKHYINLSRNMITSLYEDRLDNIWIGVFGMELYKIDRQRKSFALHNRSDDYPESLTHSDVISLYVDKSGRVWFGTRGLDIYNPSTQKYSHYYATPGDSSGLSDNWISGIQENEKGHFWITTNNGGINIFNPDRGTFQHIFEQINDPNGLISNSIKYLLKSKNGDFWIGTANAGIQLYQHKTGNFMHFDLDPDTDEDLPIYTMCEDNQNTLWVGTMNAGMYGMSFHGLGNAKVVNYKYNPDDKQSLSCNSVADIIQPQVVDTNALWIGTDAGLNRFDLKKKTFSHYFRSDGLSSDHILRILEDDHGNIWCATTNGISVYDIRSRKIKSYGKGDGMPFTDFSNLGPNAIKGPDGQLFFSGVSGTLSFYPDQLADNPNIPPIQITDFKLFQESTRLDTSIQFKKTISLTASQNSFTFEFAALNFTNPEKNQYAYKMEGFHADWINIGNKRTATFTNLDPGEYVFWVRGSNNHGIWNNEGKSIKVIISPPFWKTNWAYFTYLFLFGLALYALRTYDQKRQRLKQQLALEHKYTENLQEIDRMKSRFFANISHEFRTPLTLILGPIKKWLPLLRNRDLKHDLLMMQRNANRLFRLINQLLDLSRLESGGMTLQAREEDIVPMLRGYVQFFESLARLKKINLDYAAENESIKVYIDRDKIEKIMYNLLSNAFKFTPEGGKVRVSLEHPPQSPPPGGGSSTLDRGEDDLSSLAKKMTNSQLPIPNADFIKISVTNTGSCIPPEKIDHIFDRFYQADDSSVRGHEGSGIGLALTKELVELHHGQITVESAIDKGTTFTVSLPLGQEHLNALEISHSAPPSSHNYEDALLYQTGEEENIRSKARKKSPLIMIIEDNPDVRFYIRGHLASSFRIIEAAEGKKGLELAIKKIPDLIISDVMMPGMDGFEVCQKLKTDERTSHIPVILLTARATTEDKINGLETGADDYLTKPFDANELRVRINNLIAQREKMRHHYLKTQQIESNNLTVTPADKLFISKIISLIDTHLAEPEYSIESLARDVGFSHSQLIRKLESLTSLTPSLFLRSRRLLYAKQLLDQKADNISQISYECGFNNLSYFSRSFKEQFGQLPSDYIKDRH